MTPAAALNPFIDIIRFTPNEKRYYLRSLWPIGLMALSAIGAVSAVEEFRGTWPYGALVAVGLLPVLPMAWSLKQYVDYFKACDEWERLIELYGICIAVLLVGLTYFGFGLLALLELVTLDGALFALFMLPAISLTYVLGKIIGRWRHG